MKKEVRFYGLLSGLLYCACLALAWERLIVIESIRFMLLAVFIFFGIKAIQKSLGINFVFADGMKSGLGIVAITGLFSLIFSYLYFTFLRPEFLLQHKESMFAFKQGTVMMVQVILLGGIITLLFSLILSTLTKARKM